jgi:cyclic-di-AMP phosphodiesterase PgpH
VHTAIRARAPGAPGLGPPGTQWFLFSLNAAALVALLVLLFNVQTGSAALRVGGIAGETVVAQRTAVYVDHSATAARRQQAIQSVPTVFETDTGQARLRRQQAEVFLSRAAPLLQDTIAPLQKLTGLRRLLPPGVSSASLQAFPTLSAADFRVVRDRTLALLEQATSLPFDSNQLATTEAELLYTLPPRVTLPQRTAIGDLLATFLAPTLVADTSATIAKRQQAAHVPAVTNTIRSGEVIVRRGDVVTPSIMDELAALGVLSQRNGWRDLVASLVFAVVVIAMLFWYLYAFHRAIFLRGRLILLIDASILMTVAAARLVTSGHVLLPFFLPVAAAPTFAAVLIAPEAAIGIAFAMAVLAGWIVANSFELTVYYFLSSAAGVLAVRQVRQLKQFVLAGVYIGAVALCISLAFGLVDHSNDFAALREYMGAAIFNGVASATLALGAFALLSEIFGVTTMLHLLELGQPNRPLLRRLMVKAPGTYNHSLIVASMVERAAEEIGADSLAAKLGALYHDVGKTANPHCFVENQLGIGNIHDELRPEESARIIRGHVAQGLRLARQFKLPRVILNAIAEHHGTMTIAYFLHKSREEPSSEALRRDESLYSYPGPKPQSKETALIMLADGCESAVRASHDHSQEGIRATVQSIFDDRIRQGQLDECPLTLGDLDLARIAFCAVLNGLYHPRIEYQEPIVPRVDAEVQPLSPHRQARVIGGRKVGGRGEV